MPLVLTPDTCPCGSGEPYARCCEPLHHGFAAAPTAERLMRSRYSAFALGHTAYLLATWHPSTRPATLDLDPGLVWTRLEIVGTTRGREHDAAGTVAFVAHFRDRASGRAGRQVENSTFRREGGKWFYVDAVGAPRRA